MTVLARLAPALLSAAALSCGGAALAGLALAPTPAHAQSAAKAEVDAAKARGEVGEEGSGYLGFVHGGGGEAAGAVAEINAGRAQAYREAAARTGVTPAAAGEAAFRLLLGRMPPGQAYKPPGGGWTTK